jgi:hypothetical protein
MTSVVTEVTLLVWLLAAAPALAGSAFTAGARPAAGGDAGRSIRGESADATSAFVQEITAAFAATPTIGSLGDAVEASRTTFSTAEAIEFDTVLFESGLAGTTANLQLYLFDTKGRLVAGGFFFNGVAAPSDRTGFFITLSPGSVPAGRLKWLMVIFDAFGNTFVTPFQALEVR